MKILKNLLSLFYLCLVIISCNSNKNISTLSRQELPHQLIKKLTDIIVVDIFTPPVASRIYSNCSLAMYEALRFEDKSSSSITAKLKGFDSMPIPLETVTYNYSIAAIQAFCETAKKVTFSAPEISAYQDSLIKIYGANLSKDVVDSSVAFGQRVADVVAKRLGKDNYKETRGMERFEVKTTDPTRWIPTAPDYADGLEPYWSKMLTMGLDSSSQIEADPFPAYSTDKNSPFYKEMKEVYDISKNMTDEQVDIALFWDDNPFVSKHKGHVMFQDKKMTPGGHWMAIAAKACKINNTDAVKSAKTYAYKIGRAHV